MRTLAAAVVSLAGLVLATAGCSGESQKLADDIPASAVEGDYAIVKGADAVADGVGVVNISCPEPAACVVTVTFADADADALVLDATHAGGLLTISDDEVEPDPLSDACPNPYRHITGKVQVAEDGHLTLEYRRAESTLNGPECPKWSFSDTPTTFKAIKQSA